MTEEQIAAEAARTVAESIIARMPTGERTVPFHGCELRMAVPDTRTGLVDARARAVIEAATLTAAALAKIVKDSKQNGKRAVKPKDALKEDDLKRLDPMKHQRILQRGALVENAMTLKACADAADPQQLAAFDEEQLFRAVFTAGPDAPAIRCARDLTRIGEVPGQIDPFGSPASKGSASKQ